MLSYVKRISKSKFSPFRDNHNLFKYIYIFPRPQKLLIADRPSKSTQLPVFGKIRVNDLVIYM